MLDTLRQIAIFAKTVDHGSFRGAAEALRLSPSVVSYHVKQLEERLGTALIYRSTRRLSLTPDGEQLLESAYAMLSAAEAGLNGVAQQTQKPSGLLRMTVPAFLAGTDLAKRLSDFAMENEQVRLAVNHSDAIQDVIAEGYDIAIRVGELQDSTLKALKLCNERRLLVASPSYAKVHAEPQKPEDLEAWHWLELAPVWFKKPEFSKGGETTVLSNRSSRVSVNSATAVASLARTGAGLAVLPECLVADDVAAGHLLHILPKWSLPALSISAVWPSNAPKNGLIKHLLTVLREPGLNRPLSLSTG